jgi:FtsP/CotA-like multicopper oxidase with cupredoxin domain
MKGDDFRFDRTGVLQEPTYDTFGCKVFKESPATPDRLTPDVTIEREFREGDLTAPDGQKIRYWSLADSRAGGRATYPSPPIRVRQGQIVHTHLKSRKGPHTIHHHGIDTTTFNDGVGHVSFETGEYTYQWKASQTGMNIYHCHRNTVLHFQMGMFGVIIIDPVDGPGKLLAAREGRPDRIPYQVENVWVASNIDPRWHNEIRGRGHEAGLCGEDVGLNRFQPKYFLLNGVFSNRTADDPRTVVRARVGDTVVLRILNASYSVLRVTAGIDALAVAVDGHPLYDNPWERPFLIPAGQPNTLTTAVRATVIVRPTQRGTFPVTMEFRHWITGEIEDQGRGVIQTRIEVT